MNNTFFSTFLRVVTFGMLGNSADGAQKTGPQKLGTDAGIAVTDEKAMQISAVWACVQIITESVASLPLLWLELQGDKEVPLKLNDPIARLFRMRPNKYMKMRDMRRAMTFQLALWNNAFAIIERNDDDEPIALEPLHPARMVVNKLPAGIVYAYHTDKGVRLFGQESILHLKGMSVDGIVGLNRADYARESFGLAAAAERFAAKQFANGGVPGGVLSIDKFLTADQRKQAAEIYEGVSATPDRANKLWVLEGGMSYKEITRSPDVMQMIQTREFQMSDIARFFGVPSILIGAGSSSSSSWPASFEQQVLAFLTFTLQTYIDEWETALHDALVPDDRKMNVVVRHDEDDFVRMDSQAKAQLHSTLAQNGLASRNEGRKKLRLPKSDQPGADDLTVQSNLLLLNELDKLRAKP